MLETFDGKLIFDEVFQLSLHFLRHQKQIHRCRVILLPEDFDYHLDIRAPPACDTPYRARHPSSFGAFCSCWIVYELRSITASDIYRAASRYELSGNEPAHAQPSTFVSTFYVSPDLHYTCRPQYLQLYLSYGSSSPVKAWGL
jgi:hypothetical protein